MSNLFLLALLSFAGGVSYAQQLPYPSILSPIPLYAGSGSTQIKIFNQNYGAGLTALWNGSPRPTSPASNGFLGYTVTLTAADLAAPQLAVITMIDQSGAVIDTVNCPVVYNVKPTGLAFDAVRNRLYLATPAQTGDARFPPNSVVAVDLTSGNIDPVLQISSALGDIALSDDGSALYVVVEGANVVRRLDPVALTPSGDFNFRPAGTKPPFNVPAHDTLIVMPGKPGTVALEFSPQIGISLVQITIFDNGVPRPATFAPRGFTSILFSPDGNYLFLDGVTSDNTGPSSGENQPAIDRYSLGATGIPNQTPLAVSGAGAAAIVGGTLFTAQANAIDYTSMQVTGNFGVAGPIAVDAAEQRAFLLYTPPALDSSGRTPPVELVAYALPSLTTLGSQAVGIAADPALNDSKKLVRFGADGFILSSNVGVLVFHSPLAGPAPSLAAGGVVNAASQQAGPIAPGEVLSIFGTHLGPISPQAGPLSSAGAFPFTVAGVQVWFDRFPGTVLMASENQISVVAPFELQPGSVVDLQVWNYGIPSSKVSVAVVSAAPALFTRNNSGSGPLVVANADQTVNSPSPAGSIVTLFGTGGGAFVGGAPDGVMTRKAANLAGAVRVTAGGRDAPVIYAGATPGLVNGVFELSVQIPSDTPSGPVPIIVTVSGQSSPNGATLAIR